MFFYIFIFHYLNAVLLAAALVAVAGLILAFGAFLATMALFGGIDALLGAAGTAFGARLSFLSNYDERSLAVNFSPAP